MLLGISVPLSLILDFIGYPFYEHGGSYDITTGTSATYITIGRDTANVDGERIALTVAPGYLTNANGVSVPVIAAADFEAIFPGWNLMYDDMGLIVIYQGVAEDGGELIHVYEGKDKETVLAYIDKLSALLSDRKMTQRLYDAWCASSGLYTLKTYPKCHDGLITDRGAENITFAARIRNRLNCEAHCAMVTRTAHLLYKGKLGQDAEAENELNALRKMPL